MSKMRTVVVTGSASGMGAATKARFEADGQRVIGIDIRDADVVVDLGTAVGRQAAIDAIEAQSDGASQPGVPMDVVERCLAGDEAGARDAAGAVATYPATKTALAWWARRNAPTADWAGAGIMLNVVAPGAVETPLLQASREDPVIGHLVDAFPVPVGRKASADELAAFVQFLLGPDARLFCGSVVFVDGGTDAQLRADDFPQPMA